MTQFSALVIDDSETDLYIANRILKRLGSVEKVETCSSGQSALELIRDQTEFNRRLGPHPPKTVIFLDINMPGLSGFDVLESLHEDGDETVENHCLVTMLTSSNNPVDRERAMGYDMVVEYMEKPLDRSKLTSFIEHRFSGGNDDTLAP